MAKSEKTAMFLSVFLFIYKHHFLHLGFIDPFDLSNGWLEGVATMFVPTFCNFPFQVETYFLHAKNGIDRFQEHD
jgi:hypothetical protein